jgi:hypothetical protein
VNPPPQILVGHSTRLVRKKKGGYTTHVRSLKGLPEILILDEMKC